MEKYMPGRKVIMEQANTEYARKSECGTIVKFFPESNKPYRCAKVEVAWDSGRTNIVPAHYIGVFSY